MGSRTLYFILTIFVLAVGIGLTVFFLSTKEQPSDFITLYGNVDVRQVDLGFRVPGRVIDMPYQEGDFVTKGDFMGEIELQPYCDQAKEAKANVETVRTSWENAQAIFQRRAQLLPEGAVSQEDYENARTAALALASSLDEAKAALGVAEKNLDDTKVYCPNDSIVLTRIREPGTVVQASEPIYTLSLLDPIWVRAFVSEPLLGDIYFGMPAVVYTDSGRRYKGHIGFISPVAEFTPKTVETAELRTDLVYRLRIITDNPDRYFKQGMPVTVKLKKRSHDRD